MAIAGLTYPASELEQGLKAARGPASLTQMSGLGGLGVTPADIVGLETENTIARMQQRAADALSRIKAPSGGADGYSGIAFSPSTNKLFVGGMTFDRGDVGAAVQAQSLIGQPPQPAPANVATDWEPITPQAYAQYIQNLKTPRGVMETFGLGLQTAAGGLVGGSGRAAEITGLPGLSQAGRALGEFSEKYIEPSKQEQERSALIQQSSSFGRNLFDAVIQGLPSAAMSIGLGVGGIAIAGRLAAAGRLGALSADLNKARTIGAYAGAATSVFPAELEGLYQSARDAKDAQGSPAYNLEDPATRIEIASGAILSSLVQTMAEGSIAKAFSPALRGVMENASRTTARRMASGALKGGMNEAFAEGVAQIIQDTWFDPEVRSKLNASDIKALVPYVAEKYGPDILLAAGAGGILGGAFGGIANIKKGEPVNVLAGAGGKMPPLLARGEQFNLPLEGGGMNVRADRETGLPAVSTMPTPMPTTPLSPEYQAAYDREYQAALASGVAPEVAASIARTRVTIPSETQPQLPFEPGIPAPTPAPEGPLFGYTGGYLQTAPGEQIQLPLEGGAGIAPTPAPTPGVQMELPFSEPQPELGLPAGQSRLRRGAQLGKPEQSWQMPGTVAQQETSRGVLRTQMAAVTARREAAKAAPELMPAGELDPATLASPENIKAAIATTGVDQRERNKLLGLKAKPQLTQIAQGLGLTYKEAERIVKGHIAAAEAQMKQLEKYAAKPETIPVMAPVEPAPIPAAPPVAAEPIPTQSTGGASATQVGQVEQGGQPQYTGTGGQIPSVGEDWGVTTTKQEGGGQAGGGNLPVKSGAKQETLSAPAGKPVGNVLPIHTFDPRFVHYLARLSKLVGLGGHKFILLDMSIDKLKELIDAKDGAPFGLTKDELARIHTYKGKISKYLSDKVNADVAGFQFRLDENTSVLARNLSLETNETLSIAETITTVAHELGHTVHKVILNQADAKLRTLINNDFKSWRKRILKELGPDATLKQYAALLRASSSMLPTSETKIKDISPAEKTYWLGFDEWFADQVSKWATTTAKPLTVVDKFFAKIAKALRVLFNAARAEGMPTPTMQKFLDSLAPLDLLAEISETPMSPTTPGGGGASATISELGTQTETIDEMRTISDIIEETIARDVPPAARSAVRTITTNLRDWATKGVYGMAWGSYLVDMTKSLIPSVVRYFDIMAKRDAVANQLRNEVNRILQGIPNLGTEMIKPLNTFLADSTKKQVWGYQPTWFTDKDGNPVTVDIDPNAAAQWKALSPEAQAMADKVFEHGFKTIRRIRQVMGDKVRAGLTGEEWDALDPDTKKLRETTVRDSLKMIDTIFKERKGPYAPLSRFGNYVTTAKSAEYRAIDSIPEGERTPEQRKKREELRADPDHFAVFFSRSLGLAEAAAKEIEASMPGMATEFYEREKLLGKLDVPVWMQLQRINSIVSTDLREELGDAALERLNSMLMTMYIGALADGSSRRHALAREGVAGYDDMLRSFAVKGTSDAHFISSITNDAEVSDIIEQMRREAKSKEASTPMAARMTAFNEVMKRHIAGMTKEPTPIQDSLLRFNSIWTLMLMPRYYIMNATQPMMVSGPYMAGRFGPKAYSEITNVYKDLIVSFAKDKDTLKKFLMGDFELAQLKKADGTSYSKEDITVLEALRDSGLLDVGLGYDMDYWERHTNPTDDGAMGALPRSFSKGLHAVIALSRQVEVVNRIAAGMAAYRLADANSGRLKISPLEYAIEVIRETQGDMSGLNAPRFFTSFAFSKIVFQFRKFQLLQAGMLIKLGYLSMKDASPEERKVARAILGYVLGQTAVVTGALGLPLASLIGYMLAAAFGPPDEPVDAERFLRKHLGDSRLVDVLLRGVPAGIGVDFSGQLGLGNTFSFVPYAEVDVTSREGLGKTLLGIGGPIGGTAANIADGLGYMTRGDYWKGIEFMLPNGPKQAMRAYRETFDKGVTRRNGDLVVSPQEFNVADTMLQSLGFSATEMAKVKQARQWQYAYDKYFSERTTEIRRDYVEAKRAGDYAGEAAAKAEWKNLQLAKKRVGFKTSPVFSLTNAPKQQAAREKSFRKEFTGLRGEGD